jgi:hypothetical protein
MITVIDISEIISTFFILLTSSNRVESKIFTLACPWGQVFILDLMPLPKHETPFSPYHRLALGVKSLFLA